MSELDLKQQMWDAKIGELRQVVDSLNMPIDEGIIETVAIMNLLGFTTNGSCEGHITTGYLYPWIDCISNEPEVDTMQEAHFAYHLLNGDLDENDVAWSIYFADLEELNSEPDVLGRDYYYHDDVRSHPQYSHLQRLVRNSQQKDACGIGESYRKPVVKRLENLIMEFYSVDDKGYKLLLDNKIDILRIEEIQPFSVRLLCGKSENTSENDLSEDEKVQILSAKQKIMKDFTEFLKNKFF